MMSCYPWRALSMMNCIHDELLSTGAEQRTMSPNGGHDHTIETWLATRILTKKVCFAASVTVAPSNFYSYPL